MQKTARELEHDAEANVFAMHLLVPDCLLEKEDFAEFDWTKDRHLKALAKKYQVPIGVMALRLAEYAKTRYR